MIRRVIAAATSWIRPDRNVRYDRQTLAVMKRVLRPDSNAIDVGAHAGDVLRHIVRLAPHGQHYAFEPIPALCARLADRFPGVRVHQLALSDSAGTASFHWVVSNPGYSGLLRRRYDRPMEEVVEIEVRTARLDDVLPPDARIDFIKIDVEGAELQVLRGAAALIRRSLPVIVFEHGLGAADVYGTRPAQLFELLSRDYGLRISLMNDWLRGGPAMSPAEFVAAFESGSDYYFMAHPPPARRGSQ